MQYQHVTRGKAYGQKANKASSLAALLARDKTVLYWMNS